MKRMKLKLSTKRHLVILTAIISILLVIGGHLFYRFEKKRIYGQEESHLASIATLKSNQIREWFLDEITEVQIIAENPHFDEVALNYIRTNSSADSTRLSQMLRQIRLEHKLYDVILASTDGRLIGSSSGQITELDDFEKKSIEVALNQGQAVTSDLFKCRHDGEEMIFISFIAALRDDENKPIAALITRIDPAQFLYPLIESWPVPSQTAESYIFRLENDSVLYLNNLKSNPNAALSQKVSLTQTNLSTVKAFSGVYGVVSGKDYRNADVVAYVEKINGTPWFIISKIDKTELLKEMPLLMIRVTAFVLAIIFLAAFGVGLIYKLRQSSIYRELYQKETAISLQNEKFKITMNSLGDGVIVTDLEAKIQYLNKRAEELTGWSHEEARGRILGDIYRVKNEETGEKENNILEKVIKHGIVKELANHTLLVSKNGKEIPVMDTGAPVFGADGSLTSIVITFLDETEKRTQSRLLKKREKSLREFFENDITGDYSATADGKLLNCNPAFARMLGFNSPDELVGRNIKEFYKKPDERAEFMKAIHELKILKEHKVVLKHINGSELFCKENVVGVFDKSGSLVKYFGYLQDITDQMEAEEKLHHREQLLSSVVETQQELICRFLPDTTLTFVNKAYCKIFGKTEAELLGQKFLELLPESEWEDILSKLNSLNKENTQITYESPAFKADGTIITIDWTDIAIFNEEGEVAEFQSVGHDITEKLKAEQKIIYHSQMQSMLRTIASTFINIPLELVDREIRGAMEKLGHFVQADRVYIFDYDWVNYTCSNTYEWCNDGIEPQIDYLQNVPLDEIPHWVNPHKLGNALNIPDVFKLPANDGVRKILEPQGIKSLLTIPVMHDDLCVGFIGFDSVRNQRAFSESEEKFLFLFSQQFLSVKNRQIIEKSLVKAKLKAEESDKLKTAFINNISHEIRTPLNHILGFGQIMIEPELSEKERREYFEHVKQSSNRLMNTVTDYMDMAMLFSNTMKTYKKEFVLEPVFLTTVEKTKQLCAAKNLKFELKIPVESSGLTLKSDPELINKIVEKLLDNAIKFTKEGSITFGYLLKTEHIEFFVKDTGVGVDDDMQESVFKIFRQADVSTTRGYEGSGLGLTIAKGLATLLGGVINVNSQKGVGSTFTFTVPADDTKKAWSGDVFGATGIKHKENPLILIAEDDNLNYEYLAVVLDSSGHNHIHAVNGKEAVDFCRQNPEISIVLMDIKMPVMHGDEATKQIRTFRPDLPIIATTAYAQTGDEQRFLKAGCNDYIAKPIIKEKLLALIRKYI